jgi:hypothetical protein
MTPVDYIDQIEDDDLKEEVQALVDELSTKNNGLFPWLTKSCKRKPASLIARKRKYIFTLIFLIVFEMITLIFYIFPIIKCKISQFINISLYRVRVNLYK